MRRNLGLGHGRHFRLRNRLRLDGSRLDGDGLRYGRFHRGRRRLHGGRRGLVDLRDLRDRLRRARVHVRTRNLHALDELGLEREANPLRVHDDDCAAADQDRCRREARGEAKDAARPARSHGDHDRRCGFFALQLRVELALLLGRRELVLRDCVVLELDRLVFGLLDVCRLRLVDVVLGLDLEALRGGVDRLPAFFGLGLFGLRVLFARLLGVAILLLAECQTALLGLCRLAFVEHEHLAREQVVVALRDRVGRFVDALFVFEDHVLGFLRVVLKDDLFAVVRGVVGVGVRRRIDQLELLLAVDAEFVIGLHVAGLARNRDAHLVWRHAATRPLRTARRIERRLALHRIHHAAAG